MSVLWLAFAVYIIGVAFVLYTRPGIMFRADGGSWKEFGLSSKGDYTVFPFWLFAILWAFLSYVLATLGAVLIASIALRSVNTPVNSLPQNAYQPFNDIKPISSVNYSPQNVLNSMNTSVSSAPAAMPGYYVLDQMSSGPPKYIYFGQQPP